MASAAHSRNRVGSVGSPPPPPHRFESALLIMAPTGDEAPLAANVLAEAGVKVRVCGEISEMCQGVEGQCAGILLAEETLKADSISLLVSALGQQPPWSDMPVILITSGREADQTRLQRLAVFGPGANVILLERPFRPGTLVSTVEAALRSRLRQYLVRDLLQSVRTSEERYHHILESISDAFIAINRDWRITYVNPTYLKLVASQGLRAEDLLGKDLWAVFPHLVDSDLGRRYRRAMEEQRPDSLEYPYKAAGTWLEIRIFPAPETLTIYLKDITERKEQQDALAQMAKTIRDQARTFDATLSHITDFAYTFSPEGRFTYANKPLLDLLGIKLEQAVGKNFFDLGYPDDLARRLQEQIQEVFRTGTSIRDETPFTGVNGEPGFYEYIFNPILGADGSVEAVAGSTRDISERKRGEGRLRLSEAQVSSIIDNSPVGVYLVDADFRIRQVNRKALPVFGDLPGLVGSSFDQVLRILWPSKTADDLIRRFRHTLETGESYFVSGFEEDRQDRSSREYYDWQIHRLVLADGRFGVVCYFIDVSGHVAAQRKVRDAIERRNLAIAAANLGEFDWDASNDLISLTPRCAEIFGVEQQPGLTRTDMRKLLHPEDAQKARDALQRATDTHTDYDIEYRVNRPDKRPQWVATKGRGIYAPDGRPLGMVGVIQDITRRKNQEALRLGQIRVLQLIAEDQPLEAVFNVLIETMEKVSTGGMIASVMLVGPDGVHLRHAAGALHQRMVDAVDGLAIGPEAPSSGRAGHSKHPVYVPDIARDPGWEKYREAALASRLQSCWSAPILGANDKLLGVFDLYFPEVREPQAGEFEAIESIIRTAAVAIERKRTAGALASNARRTGMLSETAAQLLMAAAPQALLGEIFDRFAHELGADVYYHHASVGDPAVLVLESSAGLTRPQREHFARIPVNGGTDGIVAQTPKAVYFEDIQRSAAPELAPLRAHGIQALASHPLQAERRLLGAVSFASTQRPAFTGEDFRFINTLCDLVAASMERARLLGEVSSARDAAEQANRAKDDFLAALSHELRTPLNPVLLLATEAAADASLPPALREDFDTIAKNVQLEARLIDDLLDLTRITRGKLVLDRRPLPVHGILLDAIANVRPEVGEKQLKLTVDLCGGVPVVDCDPVRLQQVFWNVLKNAAKFTPEHGEISVRTRMPAKAARLVIEITDTGAGMTAVELDRIFDAFAQGDHAGQGSQHRFGGLGLGLAISRTLLELHAGTIRASSAGPGRGSTFTIELPLTAAVGLPNPELAAAPAPPRS